jgi:uncharacterized protein with PQ loop repeat
MKNIRCTACGAPNITTKLCEYCGANLPTTQSLSKTNKGEFDLALFEFNRGEIENLEKALSLFEKIIITDPNNQAGWLYKFLTELKLDHDIESFVLTVERKDGLNKIPLFNIEVLKVLEDIDFLKIDKDELELFLVFCGTCEDNLQSNVVEILFDYFNRVKTLKNFQLGEMLSITVLLLNNTILDNYKNKATDWLRAILIPGFEIDEKTLSEFKKALISASIYEIYTDTEILSSLNHFSNEHQEKKNLNNEREDLVEKIRVWESNQFFRLLFNGIFSTVIFFLFSKSNADFAILAFSFYNAGFTFYSSYRIYIQTKRLQEIAIMLNDDGSRPLIRMNDKPPTILNWRLIRWGLWLVIVIYKVIF